MRLQCGGEPGRGRAGEDEHLGPVRLDERVRHLDDGVPQLFPLRVRLRKRDVDGPEPGEPAREAVALDGLAVAGGGGEAERDEAEPRSQHAGGEKGRLRHADDRDREEGPQRAEGGVGRYADEYSVECPVMFRDGIEDRVSRDRLLRPVAHDRGPEGGAGPGDLRAGGGRVPGRRDEGLRYRGSGVSVDEQNAHARAPGCRGAGVYPGRRGRPPPGGRRSLRWLGRWR